MLRLGQAPCMGRRANPARAGRQQRYRRPTSAVECLATYFPPTVPLSATGYQVIARSPQIMRLTEAIAKVVTATKLPPDVTLAVDVDPVSLL